MNPSQPESTVKTLLFRLANLSYFDDTYIQYSKNKGYILLFIYEMMHEKIVLEYRHMTDTAETVMLNAKMIQHRHNETLACIVAAWKPEVNHPKDNTVDIKVSLFFKLSSG